MPYTLWSRSRLLAETDLAWFQTHSNRKTGWLTLSAEGEKLISVITAPSWAFKRLHKMIRRRELTSVEPAKTTGGYSAAVRRSTAFADMVSSHDELEAL